MWKKPGFPQTDEHPVVCLSWNDADAYCRWLAKGSGATVRLPREAEWEFELSAPATTSHNPASTPGVVSCSNAMPVFGGERS
jgi:formylglycine-generating enzyme required for sulfatase activity